MPRGAPPRARSERGAASTVSITSVIGLTELARQSDLIKSPTHRPFTVFLAASLLYLAMTAISDVVRINAERRASAGFRRS